MLFTLTTEKKYSECYHSVTGPHRRQILIGNGPLRMLNASNLSNWKSGVGKAKSYRCTREAIKMICSRYVMLRPKHPLLPVEKGTVTSQNSRSTSCGEKVKGAGLSDLLNADSMRFRSSKFSHLVGSKTSGSLNIAESRWAA